MKIWDSLPFENIRNILNRIIQLKFKAQLKSLPKKGINEMLLSEVGRRFNAFFSFTIFFCHRQQA